MAKYSDIQKDIEGVFAGSNWTGNNVSAYPANFVGGNFGDEFVKLEIIPSRPLPNYGKAGNRGQVIVQIYTQAGKGPSRTYEIADLLDSELQNKTFTNGTQTGTSSLSILGIDNDDKSLFRGDYQISFIKY